MVLKIGIFFTRSKSWANDLQNENHCGWANNLQGIHIIFFKLHKLIHKRFLCKNNKYINMMLKKLLFFVFEKKQSLSLSLFHKKLLKTIIGLSKIILFFYFFTLSIIKL